MANINAPFGLRPLRHGWGAPYNGAATAYYATGATGAIYIGDPVTIGSTANASAIQGYDVGTLMEIKVATAGDANPIHGVCVGVLPVTRDSAVYREDSTDRIVMVADDPDLVFEVQSDTASTDIAVTDSGLLSILLTGTGSNFTGLSGMTLSTAATEVATDASFQLMILGASRRVGNSVGEYGVWEVLINNHGYGNFTDLGRFSALA